MKNVITRIWVLVLWLSTWYTIRGKVVASPKSRLWWVLWVCVCLWFVYAPKCSNYALTNLLFGFWRSVWMIEMFVNQPNPIPKLQHTPLPPKCYEPRSVPQLRYLSMFTFGLVVESIKELEGVSFCLWNSWVLKLISHNLNFRIVPLFIFSKVLNLVEDYSCWYQNVVDFLSVWNCT
jgi:hypothetical protein